MTVAQNPKTLVEIIRDNLVDRNIEKKCVCTECKENNCSVSLQDIKCGYLLIDVDQLIDLDPPCTLIPSDKTRCDFLFIGELVGCNAEWVTPIELKGGNPRNLKPEHLTRQLQAGARMAEELIPEDMGNQFRIGEVGRFNFRPVLTYRYSKHSRLTLKAGKVKFYDKSYTIRIMKCGENLDRIMRCGENLDSRIR